MKRTADNRILAITLLVVLITASCLEITCIAEIKSAAEAKQGFMLYSDSSEVGITQHKLTLLELRELKSEVGVYDENKSYNQLVNGHGTGLSPPNENEWATVSLNSYMVDSIEAGSTLNSIDWSQTSWFPPIGNQGSQGSCVAWSVGYYIKTFQEAKERSWNLSPATWIGGYTGYPSTAYQDKIMSPAFVYNLINHGTNNGATFQEAIRLVCNIGISSWTKMPYNSADYTSWPSEAAWSEAPYFRGANSGIQYLDIGTDAGIESLKSLIASGNLATISIDAYKIQDPTTYALLLTSQDMLTLDNYVNSNPNHAGTIVGYDDNISYTEGGVTRYGAFKIANSWGKGGWENIYDGCYWISYQAMKLRVSQDCNAMFFYDNTNYRPTLLAKFQIAQTTRSTTTITVGLGIPTSQIARKVFSDFISPGSQPYPSNSIVMDISEFQPLITNLNHQPFFLKVRDASLTAGQITFFSVDNTIANGVPCPTRRNTDVYVNLTYQIAPALVVTPGEGSAFLPITLSGAGFPLSSFVNISYLNPNTSTWLPFANNVLVTLGDFYYNGRAPDLNKVNIAGDHPAAFSNITFRAQDSAHGYSCNTTVPYREWSRGLSQVGNLYSAGLFGNGTDLSRSIFFEKGSLFNVSGQWFSPGNISVFLDNTISIGNFSTDSFGFFSAYLAVPQTTAGLHTVLIRDNSTDFTFSLTCLPSIASDYDGAWHTADFNIMLTPDYAINEIFYRINNGATQNVTANGQPFITTEAANNTLEYWGIWDIYGSGMMELPHVNLAGIRLDKAMPTGSLTTNPVATSTTITLTLAANDVSGVAAMRFSNDGAAYSDWEPYATSKNWILTGGDGQKTVSVQYLDNANLISTYSYTLTLTRPQPSSAASASATPTSTAKPTQTPTTTPTSTSTPVPTPQIPEFNLKALLALLALATVATALLFKRKQGT